MKQTFLILLIASLVSCKKDITPYGGEFKKSEQTWNTYKNSISNSYSYITSNSSVFGDYAETKIIVQNGKVTGRMFISGIYKGNPAQLDIRDTWTGDLSNINTHNNGAESLTLDDIYRKAKKDWLSVDAKANEIYFSTDTSGIIASCGYVPKGCQDDCFIGVNIKALTKL